jgi:hypothetical protein
MRISTILWSRRSAKATTTSLSNSLRTPIKSGPTLTSLPSRGPSALVESPRRSSGNESTKSLKNQFSWEVGPSSLRTFYKAELATVTSLAQLPAWLRKINALRPFFRVSQLTKTAYTWREYFARVFFKKSWSTTTSR